MPELPEVETIVRGLQQAVIGLKITDIWCQYPQTIKTHSIANFTKALKGAEVLAARRRAKYILLDLNNNQTIAIHQKMSGHLLYGKWHKQEQKVTTKTMGTDPGWIPLLQDLAYHDPYNRFIRFIIFLNNGQMLGLSDVRRFARIYLGKSDKLEQIHDFAKLGPEPLAVDFSFNNFQKCFKKRKGLLKKVLMDPYVIAGIGNIYADEILWYSGLHPLARVEKLSLDQLKKLHKYTRLVLTKAIAAKGHSEMNYRKLDGQKGEYQLIACAYQRHGTACKKRDGGILQKLSINNRSAHFCPVHQSL